MKYVMLTLLLSTSVFADTEYDKIIQQPPLIKAADSCQELVDNYNKFTQCMLPILKTADCRFRAKKTLERMFTVQLPQEIYQQKFMQIFNECYYNKVQE